MKKIDFTKIGKGAPYALVTGMVCFVAAYVITNPWIKNSLLLAGLAAVVISVGLYITAWKHEYDNGYEAYNDDSARPGTVCDGHGTRL